MAAYGYVIEITATVDAAGTQQTFRYASAGHPTGPTETPANTPIAPLIVDILSPGVTTTAPKTVGG